MSKWKAVSGTFAVLLLGVILLGIVLYSRLVPKEFEDVFVYDTPAYGVKNIAGYCDAYAELINRDSSLELLLTLVKQRKEQFKNELSAEEEITNDCLACLIYYQEKFQEKLTEEDREFLKAFSNIIKSWEKEDGTYN